MAIEMPIGRLLSAFFPDNAVELPWSMYDVFTSALIKMVQWTGQIKGDTRQYNIRSAQLHMIVGYRLWKKLTEAASRRDPTKSKKQTQKIKLWHDEALALIRLLEVHGSKLNQTERQACDLIFNQIAKNYL